jgi:phage anti-repressor protein
MKAFLKQFSSIPPEFTNDFYVIAKEEYSNNQLIINLEIITKWLNSRKGDIKNILIKNFEIDYDYIIKKIRIKHKNSNGASIKENILVTPDCFKEICMISQTPKAKQVRKYFIELEKLIKRYFETIKENLYKKIGLLETNQKPKISVKGGVIYIIIALNSDITLYKLGKSKDLRYRLNGYNSGNANDIEPLFIIPVNDIDQVEKCVKNTVKKHQYRKWKEVYEIDIQVLKEIMEKCNEFVNEMSKLLIDKIKKKQVHTNISRMKNNINKHFIYIFKNNNDNNDNDNNDNNVNDNDNNVNDNNDNNNN